MIIVVFDFILGINKKGFNVAAKITVCGTAFVHIPRVAPVRKTYVPNHLFVHVHVKKCSLTNVNLQRKTKMKIQHLVSNKNKQITHTFKKPVMRNMNTSGLGSDAPRRGGAAPSDNQ